MSELKARHIVDVYDSYYAENPFGERSQVYLKSEADKVIAELEESHKKEVKQLLILNREQANAASRLRDSMEQTIRRNKFKRCLGMAKICENKLGTVVKPGWWDKWRKRWLELAEKFKEEK